MIRPPFPTVIDSSMLSAFKSCPRKAYLGYFEHWKPAAESVHLVAGKAFASGVEAGRRAFYIDHAAPEDAIALGLASLILEYGTFETPENSPKSLWRMAGALEFYFHSYPLGADGARPHIFPSAAHGIEFSFCQPFPAIHPETGDPLLFSGRADMAADAFGGVFLYDEKTTARLGAQWLNSWDHRSQFTSYCWGFREYGYKPAGVVVRGISILKESYDTAQIISYRSDWEIERWLETSRRVVERMITCWKEGYWDYNLDDACNAYGGCSFTRVCKSPAPDGWLELYFHRKRWDPVARTETFL